MDGSLINLSKQDLLYIIHRLDFDEISIPRTLLMSQEFDPLNLLVGFSVTEACRNHQDDRQVSTFTGNGGRLERDDGLSPAEGRRNRDDIEADSLKQRWQNRRYDALCSINRSLDLESQRSYGTTN
jgi:hypothetical protein